MAGNLGNPVKITFTFSDGAEVQIHQDGDRLVLLSQANWPIINSPVLQVENQGDSVAIVTVKSKRKTEKRT